jgi:hypothetical protein
LAAAEGRMVRAAAAMQKTARLKILDASFPPNM